MQMVVEICAGSASYRGSTEESQNRIAELKASVLKSEALDLGDEAGIAPDQVGMAEKRPKKTVRYQFPAVDAVCSSMRLKSKTGES
jgi:hypothetical protein